MVRAESGSETPSDLASLLELDLVDLGRVQVLTASRKQTSLIDAPAVVTVITSEDIARRGYHSVYEVMQHIPGTYFNTSSGFDNLQ